MPYSQGKENLFERCLLRLFETLEKAFCCTVLPSVQTKQMLLFKFVEVCRIPHEAFIVKLLNSCVTGNHIHGLAAKEMYELSLYLGRTSRLVRAECLCFLLVPDKSRSAVRASSWEVGEFGVGRSLGQFDACDLRDDFSSLFHVYVVTYVDIEYFHLVGIVERCSLYNSSAEEHRLQVCNRSDCACATYLIVYAVKSCECLFCLELVCHCPAWELGCIAQFLLILHLIDLYHDAVSCKRKCFTFCIPVVYELFNLFYAFAYSSKVRNRQSPFRSLCKGLVVCGVRQIFAQHVVKCTLQTTVCDHAAVNELERT